MLKKIATIMGMPVAISIADEHAKSEDIKKVFDYLCHINKVFSPYETTSELSKINRGELSKEKYSKEMKQILLLADKTKRETNGFFDITKYDHTIDTSGIVKGYAIHESANLLKNNGYKNFYIEIAGDIEIVGLHRSKKWKIGIENPFNRKEIIKVVYLTNKGIATSGTYIRGQHIYNPLKRISVDEIVSVTIIADNVYEADRFATAVFAMGEKGINFVEEQIGLEGYMVLKNKTAIMTSKFEQYMTA